MQSCAVEISDFVLFLLAAEEPDFSYVTDAFFFFFFAYRASYPLCEPLILLSFYIDAKFNNSPSCPVELLQPMHNVLFFFTCTS